MNPDSLRQLVACCRRPAFRGIGWPHKWVPHRVELPDFSGVYFTDPGAWDLIANRLAAGDQYELITLDKPLGATALTMSIPIYQNRPNLYVKLEIISVNKVLGRSFHVSDFK